MLEVVEFQRPPVGVTMAPVPVDRMTLLLLGLGVELGVYTGVDDGVGVVVGVALITLMVTVCGAGCCSSAASAKGATAAESSRIALLKSILAKMLFDGS